MNATTPLNLSAMLAGVDLKTARGPKDTPPEGSKIVGTMGEMSRKFYHLLEVARDKIRPELEKAQQMEREHRKLHDEDADVPTSCCAAHNEAVNKLQKELQPGLQECDALSKAMWACVRLENPNMPEGVLSICKGCQITHEDDPLPRLAKGLAESIIRLHA